MSKVYVVIEQVEDHEGVWKNNLCAFNNNDEAQVYMAELNDKAARIKRAWDVMWDWEYGSRNECSANYDQWLQDRKVMAHSISELLTDEEKQAMENSVKEWGRHNLIRKLSESGYSVVVEEVELR